MQKAQPQSQHDGDGSVSRKREQPNSEVAQAQTEIEANLAQLPNAQKTVDACIQQEDFIEDSETRTPCRLKPT